MDLLSPVENIKGVGPKTAAILQKAGIKTIRDLFYNLPRTYENYQSATNIADVRPGKIVIKGQIANIATRRTSRRGFSVTEAEIYDQTGSIRAVWFNQPYRAKQLNSRQEYYFSGLYDFKNGRYQLTSPTVATSADLQKNAAFRPIYAAHSTLKSANFERLIGNLRQEFAFIPDLLPTVAPRTRADALFAVHFPRHQRDVDQGRAYLAYEELFEFILAAKFNRLENQKLKSSSLPFNVDNTKALIANLPFQLTVAQRRAAWEILQDLEKTTPMNRLLQGDVGSGKTVVAAIAAEQAIHAGHQVALLAPTAILAAQHAENLDRILSPLGIKTTLLTGATKNKALLKQHIKSGAVDLVVGTHAILTDDTDFYSLALCIIDEQHRFGVEQRQKLALKSPSGLAPHLLSMTATPIPRSLQLTIFGDLDVSIINQLPKGRQPITTKILPEVAQNQELYPKIREILTQKQQIYWICKAIDDNPRTETASVEKQAKKLQTIFKDAKVEFLHGRMKPDEKDQIMTRFSEGRIDILVSTTVVEVGIDVKNATAIVIMDAESFGLAQLHQLRGRVGRGDQPSFCYLITSGDAAPSRRLSELANSTDGFHLAEVDLELRGPGEIYGQLQHGALDLRIATLADTKLIARAQKDVTVFAKTPEKMLQYPELAAAIRKYQQLTTLN